MQLREFQLGDELGLVVEERRAWVRTQTHTVVLDRDPEFARFCANPSGTVRRLLRVWISRGAAPRHYLGSVGGCTRAHDDLLRILRRATGHAHRAGLTPRTLRRRIVALLRNLT